MAKILISEAKRIFYFGGYSAFSKYMSDYAFSRDQIFVLYNSIVYSRYHMTQEKFDLIANKDYNTETMDKLIMLCEKYKKMSTIRKKAALIILES